MRSLSALLKALIARIRGNAGVIALVPAARIVSHIDQGTPQPCMRVSIQIANDWDCKCSNGFNATIVCDTWSEYHGDKEILEVHDALIAALHQQPLTLDDGSNVLIRYTQSSSILEPDGQIRRGICQFTLLISD